MYKERFPRTFLCTCRTRKCNYYLIGKHVEEQVTCPVVEAIGKSPYTCEMLLTRHHNKCNELCHRR